MRTGNKNEKKEAKKEPKIRINICSVLSVYCNIILFLIKFQTKLDTQGLADLGCLAFLFYTGKILSKPNPNST